MSSRGKKEIVVKLQFKPPLWWDDQGQAGEVVPVPDTKTIAEAKSELFCNVAMLMGKEEQTFFLTLDGKPLRDEGATIISVDSIARAAKKGKVVQLSIKEKTDKRAATLDAKALREIRQAPKPLASSSGVDVKVTSPKQKREEKEKAKSEKEKKKQEKKERKEARKSGKKKDIAQAIEKEKELQKERELELEKEKEKEKEREIEKEREREAKEKELEQNLLKLEEETSKRKTKRKSLTATIKSVVVKEPEPKPAPPPEPVYVLDDSVFMGVMTQTVADRSIDTWRHGKDKVKSGGSEKDRLCEELGHKAYSFINSKQAEELTKIRNIEEEFRIKEKEIGYRQDEIVLRHIFDTKEEAEKEKLWQRFIKMKALKLKQTEEQIKLKEEKLIEQEKKAEKIFANTDEKVRQRAATVGGVTKLIDSSGTLPTRKPNPILTDPVLLRKKAMEMGITVERLKQLNALPEGEVKRMQKIVKRWLLQRSWKRTMASFQKVEQDQTKAREIRLAALKEIIKGHADYQKRLEVAISTFVTPLKGSLEAKEVSAMFAPLEGLAFSAKDFQSAFNAKLAKWPTDEHFGDLFIDKLYAFVDKHTEYIQKFPKTLNAVLEVYHSEDSPLVPLVKSNNKPGTTFSECFLLPVGDAISSYSTTMKRLLDCTDSTHLDYDSITVVIENLDKVKKMINEKKRQGYFVVDLSQKPAPKEAKKDAAPSFVDFQKSMAGPAKRKPSVSTPLNGSASVPARPSGLSASANATKTRKPATTTPTSPPQQRKQQQQEEEGEEKSDTLVPYISPMVLRHIQSNSPPPVRSAPPVSKPPPLPEPNFAALPPPVPEAQQPPQEPQQLPPIPQLPSSPPAIRNLASSLPPPSFSPRAKAPSKNPVPVPQPPQNQPPQLQPRTTAPRAPVTPPPDTPPPPPPREDEAASVAGVGQMPVVTALYKHVGMQSGDLSFEPGDVIKLLENTGNWWKGECGGRVGVFPKNYVA